MTHVALLRCGKYSLAGLKEVIDEGIGTIGFPLRSFRGSKVALKPNLLTAASPESGVVTHPCFFEAAAQLVIDYGGRPVLVESPAVVSLHSAVRKAGYAEVLKRLQIETADISAVAKLSYPEAGKFKTFEISKAFFDADLIVNLPKFKTHGLTYVTAAVKNLFGAVPGMRKSQMHLKCPDREEFSSMVLDLYGAFLHGFNPPKALLHVMDAVTALEGDGPGTGGAPKAMNAVVIGADALAVDWVATRVSGLDTRLSPILVLGFRRGFGVSSESEIEVLGGKIEEMRVHGFVPPRGAGATGMLGIPVIRKTLKRLFTPRPVPVEGRCSLCLRCRTICPAQAIAGAETGQGVPRFDYGKCIRCCCCMEVCPENAISLRKGGLQRLLGRT
ncbi:MAG TPA: DUF362 domain-containing protein [Deltaproteobacteria bacterium]|nr:DUF362 domain-containing protein [Deltaproteobacteria bacterium]HQJ08909.1 DUF362 domain-containing protein [Deltaproteobacteria bacterium]